MNEPVTADTSIATRFREVAASIPGTAALVTGTARYSFAELDRWSDAIAAELLARGAPRSLPVAIVMTEPVPIVPAMLGVAKAGHFYVVLDGADPEERLRALLAAAGSTVCVVDGEGPAAVRGLDAVRVGACPSEPVAPPEAAPNEILQLVFTSGTTGDPKAVVNRQRGFAQRLVRLASRTRPAAGERVSYTALPGHARAPGEILGTLLNGATLCAFNLRSGSLDALAELIARERISILTLTPAFFRRFVRALPEEADLSSVRKLRIGADVMTMADVDTWRARFPATATLERAYASTETGQALHISITHDMPLPGPLVPMGRPIRDVDVRIVGDDGNEVGEGETGELVVRSPIVAHGYWNAPELTAERFVFDEANPDTPAFRTGDLVRRDADGLFYFVGRLDARFKIHGRRVDPVEVESAMMAHAGVREAVAMPEPDADGEMQLAAWIVGDGDDAAARQIRAAMRGNVPSWMIPARVRFIDELPMTRRGKVDRAALARRAATERARATFAIVTDDALERTLLEVWSGVLRRPVEAGDDFFEDLGGTSLDALEIVARISRTTGRSLPLSLLLELNTVRKLADYLAANPDAERTVIALNGSGKHPPLFCVSGKGGSVIVFRALAEALGPEQPFYGVTYHGIDPNALPATLAALAACYADAIRAKQPEGPYYLAGYSAGGFIAWEIARQLTQAGHEVAFVGLLDTVANGERRPLLERCGKYVRIFRRDPAAFVARAGRGVRLAVRLTAAWLRAGGSEPFIPPVEANRFYDSLNLPSSLKPYSGPATLVLAREGRGAEFTRTDEAWRALNGDGFDVVHVDGEHDSILTTEVAGLARELSFALERARARVSAATSSKSA